MKSRKLINILMAEDDPDDRLLAKEAFEEVRLANSLYFVNDGIELMDYLHRQGKYKDPKSSPRPGVILLDLNMPRKDGKEAIKEIKSDPNLKCIPIVVLTTSKAEEDILKTYNLGVSSFITKPVTFDAFVDVLMAFSKYYLEIIELPSVPG
jgi:CheY-like chemotaxis protein